MSGPHDYTDRRGRNLCDTCDRWQGHKDHAVDSLAAAAPPVEPDTLDPTRDYGTFSPTTEFSPLSKPGSVPPAPAPVAEPPECDREKWCDMPGGHSGECRSATDALADRCDIAAGVHRGTCAGCIGTAAAEPTPGLREAAQNMLGHHGVLAAAASYPRDPHVTPGRCEFADQLVAALAASPAPEPTGLDAALNDLRKSSGAPELAPYWRGFNDGIDKLADRLRGSSGA